MNFHVYLISNSDKVTHTNTHVHRERERPMCVRQILGQIALPQVVPGAGPAGGEGPLEGAPPLKIKVFLWQNCSGTDCPLLKTWLKGRGRRLALARSVTWSRTQTTSSSDARWPGSLGAWFGPRTGCLGTRGPPAILWQSLTRSRGVVNVCCGAVFGHCSGRFG